MILTFFLLTSFFIGAVLFRKITSVKICAICFAVGCTWLVLIFLYFTKGNIDPLILGILMGGSIVGAMYYLSSKLPERYQLFKFPFILSMLWVVLKIIKGVEGDILKEVFFMGIVWVLFGIIFILYSRDHLKEVGKRFIECCKNW